jgi:flagellar motor switch protein FliN
MANNQRYNPSSRKALDIEQMQDIRLPISMILGHKKLSIRQILNLAPGSILVMDRMAGENADLVVNQKILAKGEVVVMNNHLGFRLVNLLTPEERLRNL